MQRNALDLDRAAVQIQEIASNLQQVGWARDLNLRVVINNDGVGVMPGVAPAPQARFTDSHEGRNLVEEFVEWAGLECGAVLALMPARIARRVDGSVEQERRQCPPRSIAVKREIPASQQ